MTRTTSIDRDQVVATIVELLPQVIAADTGAVTEDAKLFDELGLDSTGVLDLMLKIEEELDVEFDTENLQLGHFESVRTLADFVIAEAG
ncbi:MULTISPECIES: acyl carrier protein [Dactylosporangium]|uniref:Acyl carrier protein n=2 Tax=Dactylosporangium TaxID=35753 RepID=A0A9W6KGT6_9ACTN|nr:MULTISPECIES: acyl carrier protein [Dactylosporangium]UAB94055.1 acyl carrier protein [Dactylosporangium vinaceum]UWZ42465.1 acyl carrier protein [Dactylosporangium matsuzakiense]GLL00622.1 acyl carrier protein [Dactylosporangium matsuzakiense]